MALRKLDVPNGSGTIIIGASATQIDDFLYVFGEGDCRRSSAYNATVLRGATASNSWRRNDAFWPSSDRFLRNSTLLQQ